MWKHKKTICVRQFECQWNYSDSSLHQVKSVQPNKNVDLLHGIYLLYGEQRYDA